MMARFEVEQVGSRRWVGHVEIGFPYCRKRELKAETFDDIVSQIIDVYRGQVPHDAPVREAAPEPELAPMPEIPKPQSRHETAAMRKASDQAAAKADPDLELRRAALRSRR